MYICLHTITYIEYIYKKLSYPDRLKKLKIPTLSYRRLRGDMIETYKILTQKYASIAAPDLQLASHVIGTRGHKYKLNKNHHKTRLRQHFFSSRVIEPWNNLSPHVIEASSTNSFKNRLDKYWGNQDIMYDYESPLNYKQMSKTMSRECFDLDKQD